MTGAWRARDGYVRRATCFDEASAFMAAARMQAGACTQPAAHSPGGYILSLVTVVNVRLQLHCC